MTTQTPLRTAALFALVLLIAHGARPEKGEEARVLMSKNLDKGVSLVETVASGHMVDSGHTNLKRTHSEDGEGDGEIGDSVGQMAALYGAAQESYEAASNAVWTKDMKDNRIRKTGFDWMNSVASFKKEAGDMRADAEKIYKSIVKSHTQAAQKMMLTLKEEMPKIKKLKTLSEDKGEPVEAVYPADFDEMLVGVKAAPAAAPADEDIQKEYKKAVEAGNEAPADPAPAPVSAAGGEVDADGNPVVSD